MAKDNDLNDLIECPLNYSLSNRDDQITAKGEASARLDEENLSILPKLGEALFIQLRDIINISYGEYRVFLELTSKEKIILFNLGYRYEDFLRLLCGLRNEVLLKDMLMQEKLLKSGVEADITSFDENGKEIKLGKCEPRLYETALVLMPEIGDLKRIPYSEILEVSYEDYAVSLKTEFDEKYVLSRMGKELDPFKKIFSEAMNELSIKVQSSLKELLPEIDPLTIRKMAGLMREGKAAKRSNLDSLSPNIWTKLEEKLRPTDIKEEYDFLKSMAQRDKMCIGLKRGLMGELTGEYIWFLIPLYSTDPKKPGNAIAMESVSDEGGGRATYFFRITGRDVYRKFKNIEDLHKEADNFIKLINRCMLAVNFRREPIYLPEKKLEEADYIKYQFAIQKLPELRTLRNLYIGRVMHLSFDQWKKDVMDLLEFNARTVDNSAKWKKGE
ncbi:MAG: hypothetical protein M1371_09565 [Actinobacteria bacterium]|nr:hypothetical protein [Actinomycetota bacterium]